MDDTVLAAMAQWPGVPDVYGWLSLSEHGRWRLHPDAGAWRPGQPCSPPHPPGEAIENPQIRAFIDRNYACDAYGQWYFQNGPQRVYARLDAAPYVLLACGGAALALETHNGLAVERIEGWWLDDHGRLYAQTEHGAGLVSGRDTPSVVDALRTPDGEPLVSLLESLEPFVSPGSPDSPDSLKPPGSSKPSSSFGPLDPVRGALARDALGIGASSRPAVPMAPLQSAALAGAAEPAPLRCCAASDIALRLGFVPCPQPRQINIE